jgi:hypothetical protein
MAIVWECPCGVQAKTCYLTPDGKAPQRENCPICKRKLKKVGTTPLKIRAECIMAMAGIALKPL